MIGNRFYTWFKNYYQWVGGAFNETLLLPLVRATSGLRAGAIRYDEVTDTVETYDGTNWNPIPSASGFVPTSRTITINGTSQDLSANRIYTVGDVRTDQTYTNPAWITALAWSKITNTPTSLSGYGITDGVVTGRTLTINGTSQDLSANRTFNVGTVTSVELSAPAAFNVSGSPVTSSGTLALTAAGLASQYVRGDGTLANFPTTQGGGSSVSYYLNGSVNQGTFGGSTYYEMNRTPILGAGTNFSRNTDGYIASFITDANDPGFTEIPGGNFNLELYFSASSGGGTPTFYVELYKYDGTNFTLIASNQTSPDTIVGATKDAYFTAIAVPQTSLTITDRLAIRVYVTVSGRTITFHTENNNLAQIITTFSTGINTLNGLTKQVQFLTTGTGGTDFNINSTNSTHTFNIPTASATNRGALSSADWATFNAKQAALTLTTTGNSGAATLVNSTLNIPQYTASGLGAVPTSRTLTINGTAFDLSANRSWSVGTVTSVGLTSATSGVTITDSPVTVSGTIGIAIATANGSQQGLLSSTDWATFNNKQNTLSLTTSGTSGAATLIGATLNVPQYQAQGNYITSLTGEATASGPGAASVTLSTTAVTGKLLTGLNLSGGGTIAATDSILQAFGKVQNQISAMVGGVMYQGTWNASTNTPTLTSSVGTKGNYYIVDVSGTTNLNGITDWRVGDWAIFNGSTWDKVDNTDAVSSVNGFTGAVSLTTSHIAEGTNLYYLDSRSRTAISLTTTGNSGAATYSSVSGIINVPQYTLSGLGGVPSTRQLTINGTAFDLSADRSWNVGTVTSVGLNSTTSGVNITNTPVTGSGALTINIATASGSQNGLLSSTDWTTFNNKQNALNGTGFVKISGTTISYDNSTYLTTSAAASTYVPYIGATSSVGLGLFSLSANGIDINGTGSQGGILSFAQYGASSTGRGGFTTINAIGQNNLWINFAQAAAIRSVVLDSSSISDGAQRFYTLPNASGTLALTSNINSAVSGSTGQVAYFNGTNSVTGESNLFWDAANDRLGIGKNNPAVALDVVGSGTFSSSVTANSFVEIIGDLRFNSNSADRIIYFRGVAGSPDTNWKMGNYLTPTGAGIVTLAATVIDVFGGASGYGFMVRNTNNTSLFEIEGSTGVARLSGNLGLGVTPSAWGSIFVATQIGVSGSFLLGRTDAISQTQLGSNAFFDGSNWKYFMSGSHTAARYFQNGGEHVFENAIAGTGGNNITWNTRMLITSGGNVGIGTTSPSATLHVNGTIQTGGISGGSAVPWKLGNASAGTTSTTILITVEVNGSTYLIPAAAV